jgi:exosome complex component RRP43
VPERQHGGRRARSAARGTAARARPPAQHAAQRAHRRLRARACAAQPAAFKRLYPSEYHRRFLQEGLRADGRALLGLRRTAVAPRAVESAEGSAIARVGNTTVVCGVKLEVGVPQAGQASWGSLGQLPAPRASRRRCAR